MLLQKNNQQRGVVLRYCFHPKVDCLYIKAHSEIFICYVFHYSIIHLATILDFFFFT